MQILLVFIKKYLYNFTVLLSVFFLLMVAQSACAQTASSHDSLYYQTFPNALTARIYAVKDYTGFTLNINKNNPRLVYKANTLLGTGVGVTYKNVSGNISTSFGFLNKRSDDKGKTKSLDLQFHFFPRKWTSDLLLIHYKGFYAAPLDYSLTSIGNFYYRPDIQMNLFGFTLYRVRNSQQFSYRSLFNQNEWIKKSSGTLLYGGAVYYEKINSGDSSLVPSKIADITSDNDFNTVQFISFGPGIGYAQTVVFQKHFYVLGSAIINGNINFFTSDRSNSNDHKTSFEPGLIFKTGIGYGGKEWNVGLNWAGNILLAKQGNIDAVNIFPASEVRLMFAKQITLKKPIPFVSNVIDGIFGKED